MALLDGVAGMLPAAALAENEELIGRHIKNCSSCRAYANVTAGLNSLKPNGEKVELWNEFLARAENRKKYYTWRRPVYAVLSLVLIITVCAAVYYMVPSLFKSGTSILSVKENNSESVNGENVSSVVQVENSGDKSDLDYYYEISMDI